MKLSELYGLTGYVNMLEKTDLLGAKKQIKEMYLQNLLATKDDESAVKTKVDPVVQAYLDDRLCEYLDRMEVLPGFEKARDVIRISKHKDRSSHTNSRQQLGSQDDAKHRRRKKQARRLLSKAASTTEDAQVSAKRSTSP